MPLTFSEEEKSDTATSNLETEMDWFSENRINEIKSNFCYVISFFIYIYLKKDVEM